MPKWLHRTTKVFLSSVSLADLPEVATNYIEEPNFSAVLGQPPKYWTITGDIVTLKLQVERDAIDIIDLNTRRDSVSNELDPVEDILRAFALAVLDELNAHALKVNEILDAIDSANNLSQVKTAIAAITDYPQRTIANLKTSVRNKLGT